MFAKVFALFALFALAFAVPEPKPQYLTYAAAPGVYPAAAAYSAYPYSAYSPYAAAATIPYAYSGYYVR